MLIIMLKYTKMNNYLEHVDAIRRCFVIFISRHIQRCSSWVQILF